jgi:hypothetical protein
MNKVRQKVSGGFRSLKAGEEFMKIRSLIATAIKRGADPIETLKQVFTPGDNAYMELASAFGTKFFPISTSSFARLRTSFFCITASKKHPLARHAQLFTRKSGPFYPDFSWSYSTIPALILGHYFAPQALGTLNSYSPGSSLRDIACCGSMAYQTGCLDRG